jgi:hypothetical protein
MFDLTWREIRNDLAIAGRSLVGRWQQTAALFAVAVLMSMTGLAASSSAATTSPSAAPAAAHVNSVGPWYYAGKFFFKSDCEQTGQNGVLFGAWKDYQCSGGGPLSDWVLLVRYS